MPYYFRLAPNRGLTVTPHVFTSVAPMAQAQYRALNSKGAYRIARLCHVSPKTRFPSDRRRRTTSQARFAAISTPSRGSSFDPNWSVTGSLRLTTDRTFLRRYDISDDDRLRSTVSVERIDPQQLSRRSPAGRCRRCGSATARGCSRSRCPRSIIAAASTTAARRRDRAAAQHARASPRTAGQDTQRAFASARWDLRRMTPLGPGSDADRLCARRCLQRQRHARDRRSRAIAARAACRRARSARSRST